MLQQILFQLLFCFLPINLFYNQHQVLLLRKPKVKPFVFQLVNLFFEFHKTSIPRKHFQEVMVLMKNEF